MWPYPAHFICAPKVMDSEAEATAPVIGYFVVAMIREAPGAIVNEGASTDDDRIVW